MSDEPEGIQAEFVAEAAGTWSLPEPDADDVEDAEPEDDEEEKPSEDE